MHYRTKPYIAALMSLVTAVAPAMAQPYEYKKFVPQLVVAATFASSCKTYLQANPGASSGWYTLDVDGSGPVASQSYYCDMTSDGGGWTRIVRQTEAAPVTNWNGGTNGSSYALSALNIPGHTQVGFGKDDAATFVDYVDWTYQSGDIALATVTSPKTGAQYFVHRSSTRYYGNHNPRSGLAPSSGASSGTWAGTLTFINTAGVAGENAEGWSYSALNETAAYRGYRMQSLSLYATSEPYAWTVWVR